MSAWVTCRAVCLAVVLAVLPEIARADEQLLGSWVGTGADNQGARVTVERDAVTIDGARMPLKFLSPGVLVIGTPDGPSELRYQVQGDALITVDEDGRATWRRVRQLHQPLPVNPPQPNPQPNPLSDTPCADVLARTFSGDGLTLALEGSASKGYVGTLTRNGATYPVQARATGNGLLGTFKAGESSFEFKAELQGNVLSLLSGGATYRLAGTQPAPAPPRPPIGNGGKPPVAPAGPVVMVQHTVRDPGVGNMESHTLLAPKGWAVSGGAWWANTQYFNVLPSRDIKVTAPDGQQVHLAPSFVARDILPPPQFNQPRPPENSADKGIPVLYMPASLEEWKRWIKERSLAQSHPKATQVRVTNAVVVPELTAMLNKQIEWRRRRLAQQAQLDASIGMRTFIGANVYAFECTYTEAGRNWEELIIFGTTYEGLELQLIGRSTTWDVNPAVIYRAPAGALDASMPLMVSIVNTLRETPQWARMRAEHQAKLAGIAAKGLREANQAAMERSRIISNANREINEIIVGGHKQRETIRDATHRKVINSIRGTEDYVVPGSTTTVQLPNSYQKVYSNGNGEYLLTNDLLYDPNTDSTRNSAQWTTLKARR